MRKIHSQEISNRIETPVMKFSKEWAFVARLPQVWKRSPIRQCICCKEEKITKSINPLQLKIVIMTINSIIQKVSKCAVFAVCGHIILQNPWSKIYFSVISTFTISGRYNWQDYPSYKLHHRLLRLTMSPEPAVINIFSGKFRTKINATFDHPLRFVKSTLLLCRRGKQRIANYAKHSEFCDFRILPSIWN